MSGSDGRPPRRGAPRPARLGVGQMLGLSIGVLLLIAAIWIVLALVADGRLTERRTFLVDGISPALNLGFALENALVDQETGVRGYLLTGEQRFLEPYRAGRRSEEQAYRDLGALDRAGPAFAAQVRAVRSGSRAWRSRFVDGALADARDGGRASPASLASGTALFDDVRGSLDRLQHGLERQRLEAREELYDAAGRLRVALVVAGGLIIASLIGAGLLLRTIVTRPLARLGRDARSVASGRFDASLDVRSGPREIAQVAHDVEAMRDRIVRELAAVEAARTRVEEQAHELARSNADLEQFAYVASHDLQEPLRKIASFCQVLERRYRGQLDERADQYIDFIVDGAKRMQLLINDLLAFSRVGHTGAEQELIDADDLVEQAQRALAVALEDAGATIEAGGLPVVRGEHTLLVAVFQNLIGNAVKFRRAEPPVVRIRARDDGPWWEFSCADNGIGVDPEFAERIFVIFQRLHSREAYVGTGIGLALCRKIIEFHGGRIWLDTHHRGGTCFRFTLPKAKETQ